MINKILLTVSKVKRKKFNKIRMQDSHQVEATLASVVDIVSPGPTRAT